MDTLQELYKEREKINKQINKIECKLLQSKWEGVEFGDPVEVCPGRIVYFGCVRDDAAVVGWCDKEIINGKIRLSGSIYLSNYSTAKPLPLKKREEE